jgi:hypothetical protein
MGGASELVQRKNQLFFKETSNFQDFAFTDASNHNTIEVDASIVAKTSKKGSTQNG